MNGPKPILPFKVGSTERQAGSGPTGGSPTIRGEFTRVSSRTASIVWTFVLASLLCLICLCGIDQFFVALLPSIKIPGDLADLFQLIGFFGHGGGVLIAILLIAYLDPQRNAAIKSILGATLLSGMVVTLAKIVTHRPRPFMAAATEETQLTFAESLFQNSMQSFPSGHTATACALALSLSLRYPDGRPLFVSLAIAVGVQRMMTHSHFPSDVVAGAVVGWLSVIAIEAILAKSRRQSSHRDLDDGASINAFRKSA